MNELVSVGEVHAQVAADLVIGSVCAPADAGKCSLLVDKPLLAP